MRAMQALAFIDSVLAQVNADRATHRKIIEAMDILREALKKEQKDATYDKG
jgi:hypothetical protein